MNIKKFNRCSLVLLTIIGLSACSSENKDVILDDNIKTGVFLDSAIEGLKYKTATQSGITDKDGKFNYKENEEVEFKVGEIVLGKAAAQDILSPLNLANTLNPNDTKVLNMLQFLQSIDDDNNPNNGIKITEALKDMAQSDTSNFSDGSFIDVNSLLTSLNVSTDNIVTKESALMHFKATLSDVINKPVNADEYSIIEGIYQDKETIIEITNSGLINSYSFDNINNCINRANENELGYDLDGLFLTHEEQNMQFTVNGSNNNMGWKYDASNQISQVFLGGFTAGSTLTINGAFLTTKKSLQFTSSNLKENMCSEIGESNKFINIKGVYQYNEYVDSNATLQDVVRNTVTYIDSNATIHSYKYDATNSCLLQTEDGDYNFALNGKNLSKGNYNYTVDGNSNLIEYYYKDSNDNRFSWLENDSNITIVGYQQGTNNPYLSTTILNVTNLKYSLTMYKSSDYSDNNISNSICP